MADLPESAAPRLAVVGHPNKGKSSLVATLAEDDSVGISPTPGTTLRARAYPMRVDGKLLYTLVDTPAQRLRIDLGWSPSSGVPRVMRSSSRTSASSCGRSSRARGFSMWSTAACPTGPSTRRRWRSCAGPGGRVWR